MFVKIIFWFLKYKQIHRVGRCWSVRRRREGGLLDHTWGFGNHRLTASGASAGVWMNISLVVLGNTSRIELITFQKSINIL